MIAIKVLMTRYARKILPLYFQAQTFPLYSNNHLCSRGYHSSNDQQKRVADQLFPTNQLSSYRLWCTIPCWCRSWQEMQDDQHQKNSPQDSRLFQPCSDHCIGARRRCSNRCCVFFIGRKQTIFILLSNYDFHFIDHITNRHLKHSCRFTQRH